MGRALSLDLRKRLSAAVDSGMSCRTAPRSRGSGSLCPARSAGGNACWRAGRLRHGNRSPFGTGPGAWFAHLVDDRRSARHDVRETVGSPAGRAVSVRIGTLWRFFDRYCITRRKRTARAREQDRPDILNRRLDWFEGQLDLDPDRLVFFDETWASTNMARCHGRSRACRRL